MEGNAYHFGGRVNNLDLLQNGGSIISDDDMAFSILNHLVHTSWTETGSNDICERYF